LGLIFFWNWYRNDIKIESFKMRIEINIKQF